MTYAGIVSALCGFAVVGAALVLDLSSDTAVADDGPLVHAIGPLWHFVIGSEAIPEVSGELAFRAPPKYELQEGVLQEIVAALAIVFSVLAAYFAVRIAAGASTSLWYSLGIFAAGSALITIYPIIGGVYFVVAVYFVLRARKWQMSSR